MKKLIVLFFVAIMSLSTSAAFAAENTKGNMNVDQLKQEKTEIDKLEKDIAKIESVSPDELESFYEENKEWIADVNDRLDAHMASVPEDEKEAELLNLRDGDNQFSTMAVSSKYFNDHYFHKRNGMWTYSMWPKTSTRLLRSYASAGWTELTNYYSNIDTNSLEDQYWCHFEAFIESDWDIEQGRPDVGLIKTIAALCNP
ncbi:MULTISPECIES: DUF2599 domain-containing protein [Rossellomorea]|jgi:hypothetical protein|uniref:DUF2599 domain-containing protein n=1 Tax=Rossellomorea TaxID=2837508 RepID=UPI0011E8A9A7|nr:MULTISPECIES: DUF2599 domain-containing protein [Rossellomorea]MDT9025074.1 DUF2599 domain-containing protein [Rossellomorea sp. YC4-1]TYS86249.1 DUF2599 domain-containing protein [Rossellomorea aquimaris]